MGVNRVGSLPKENVCLPQIEDENLNKQGLEKNKPEFYCPNCNEPLMDELSQMARWYNVGRIVHPWTKEKLQETIEQSPYYCKEEDNDEEELNFFKNDENDLSFLDELDDDEDNFFKLDDIDKPIEGNRLSIGNESKFGNSQNFFESDNEEKPHKKIENKRAANYYKNYKLNGYGQRATMSAA